MRNKDDKKRIKEDFLDIFRGRESLFNVDRKFHGISFLDALAVYVKLKYFNEIEKKKILCRKVYEEELKNISEISIFPDSEDSSSVRPFFLILAEKRDFLMKYFYKKGIICELSYPPVILFKKLGDFNPKEFYIASRHWRMGLRLPLFPYMESQEAVTVSQEMKNFYARNK